jgi:hypothetical protein
VHPLDRAALGYDATTLVRHVQVLDVPAQPIVGPTIGQIVALY